MLNFAAKCCEIGPKLRPEEGFRIELSQIESLVILISHTVCYQMDHNMLCLNEYY